MRSNGSGGGLVINFVGDGGSEFRAREWEPEMEPRRPPVDLEMEPRSPPVDLEMEPRRSPGDLIMAPRGTPSKLETEPRLPGELEIEPRAGDLETEPREPRERGLARKSVKESLFSRLEMVTEPLSWSEECDKERLPRGVSWDRLGLLVCMSTGSITQLFRLLPE